MKLIKQKLIQALVLVSLVLGLPLIALAVPVYTDFSKPIVVDKKNKVVIIRLDANQTTGYQWFVEKNHPHVKVDDYKYVAPDQSAMGAPGHADFTVKFDSDLFFAPQKVYVHLDYQRPWESKPVKTQEIIFLITK